MTKQNMGISCRFWLLLPMCLLFSIVRCTNDASTPPPTTNASHSTATPSSQNPSSRSATESSPSTEASTQKSDIPAVTFDLEHLIDQIPSGYKAKDGEGWDKFTLPKVKGWLSENISGRNCSIVTIASNCIVEQADADHPNMWQVSLIIDHKLSNYHGMGNLIQLSQNADRSAHPEVFTFLCGEAEARNWDAASTPIAVKITGNVLGIDLDPRYAGNFLNIFLGYQVNVDIERPSITLANNYDLRALSLLESDLRSSGIPEGNGIVNLQKIDSKENYYLVFLRCWHDREKGNPAGYICELSLFPLGILNKRLIIVVTPSVAPDGDHTDSTFRMQCSDPPTPQEILRIKKEGGWPGFSK